MKTKDESILEIRGESIGTITESSSSEEKFQNQTLRPILKIQNDLFLLVFKKYNGEIMSNIILQNAIN